VHGATAADQDRAGATPPARAAPVPEKDAARFERPAMVYVTHRLREAESLATQVAVLLKGICVEHIAAFSSWDQVVHPYSRYLVAALTGPVPPFAAPATGCPFAPACAQAAEACRTAVPDEVEISAGHRVRCVRVAAGPQPATA
jgi:oligopeptide/dipeptide ABC transporter ATP-binding protein